MALKSIKEVTCLKFSCSFESGKYEDFHTRTIKRFNGPDQN